MTTAPRSGRSPGRLDRAAIETARRVDHVGVSVPDLDRAVDFFVHVFGASVAFRMDRPSPGTTMGSERLGVAPDAQFSLAMLTFGSTSLEVLQWWPERSDARPPDADLPGGTHVSLAVDDVASALERLRRVNGVEIVGDPVTFPAGATPGLTNAFLRTPWGALIELVAWHPPATSEGES
ncbi:MAG TPA: VOC family protein [Acidimicrobiales bacterium]|nr:VOC family protein [Acidimicrobiales bacterium]